MPDVDPTGPLSVAIEALRALISNVPDFQTWTGTVDAATAAGHIFTGEVGWPLTSISVASNVVTLTTRETHTIQVGQVVTVEGASIGEQSGVNLEGPLTVTAVGTNTFSFARVLPDLSETFPDGAFALPCARPIAVIGDTDSDNVRSDNIGTGSVPIYAGSLEILVEADVSSPYANDARNALYEARNAFGNFVEGLMETQGSGDLMVLNKVEPVSGPEFTSEPAQDDNTIRFERWRAVIRVHWGLDG